MNNLISETLEAHISWRNHHRRYRVTLGRDLPNDWTVEISCGRCGQGDPGKHFATRQADEVKALIRNRLRRRLFATKRIGCPYRLAAVDVAPSFNASLWLPGDFLARSSKAAVVR